MTLGARPVLARSARSAPPMPPDPAPDAAQPRPASPPSPSGSIPALPPGPTAPALVQGFRMFRRPGAFVEDCARRFGDCFTVRLIGAPPFVFFSHPDAVREISTAEPESLRAGEANAGLGPLLGWNSLLLLDGARHLRERRLMLPPFHGERMQAYGHAMREITDRVLDTLPLGQPTAIHRHFQHITLEVILRT